MNRFGIALFAFAVLLAGCYSFFFQEDDASYILRTGKLDGRWEAIAHDTLAEILSSSPYAKNYAFNTKPKGQAITFIIFDSRLSDIRSSKINSCRFYPASQKIFCDVRFIDAFLAERDLDKEIVPFEGGRPIDMPFDLRQLAPEQYDLNRMFLLEWVLGHEFGHFLAGHKASHFAPTPLDARVEAKSVSQTDEIEADSYLASHFNPDVGAGVNFYQNLVHLLNVEVHRKACPGMSPLQYCKKIQFGAGIFSPADIVYFKTAGTHPEYMIRLVRLIKEAHEKALSRCLNVAT
ncbi:hypothetical protein [Rhizobium mongolense]